MVALEASKLFCQLSPPELTALHRVASERSYAVGQEVFKEGDEGDGVYVVRDGLVEISGLVDQKVRLVYSKISPGDVFGEMAVIDSKPRSACAVAKVDTKVYFIPRAEMLALVARSPALALVLLREISDRLRDFNQQYLRETLQAERLTVVGRFARSIVHDLKSPLNTIGLTAEMAVMDRATPEMRRQASATIRKQIESISEMVSEILDFTQGAYTDFVLTPEDYAVFVNQIMAELAPEAALKDVTFELESPPPAVRVVMHPKRLRRVFCNLVHNATEAMPEGGKIIMRFKTTDNELVTEIEDGGSGIAPEIAGRLFEVFATYGKAHGTGLGLSICKRIIQDHKGWIAARNQPGRGAVFSFGLPRPGRLEKVK
jgi:signal transduction histidine kinase